MNTFFLLRYVSQTSLEIMLLETVKQCFFTSRKYLKCKPYPEGIDCLHIYQKFGNFTQYKDNQDKAETFCYKIECLL